MKLKRLSVVCYENSMKSNLSFTGTERRYKKSDSTYDGCSEQSQIPGKCFQWV